MITKTPLFSIDTIRSGLTTLTRPDSVTIVLGLQGSVEVQDAFGFMQEAIKAKGEHSAMLPIFPTLNDVRLHVDKLYRKTFKKAETNGYVFCSQLGCEVEFESGYQFGDLSLHLFTQELAERHDLLTAQVTDSVMKAHIQHAMRLMFDIAHREGVIALNPYEGLPLVAEPND